MRITAGVLLFITCFLCADVYASWIEKKKPIMKGVGWNYDLTVHGNTLFFDTSGGVGNPALRLGKGTYVYDIQRDSLKRLTTDFYRARAAYEKNMVTWYVGDIMFYSGLTRKKTIVGKGEGVPSLYGDWIAYGDEEGLVLHNIKKKKEKRLMTAKPMLIPARVGPVIYMDTVVWIEKEGDGYVLASYDIKNIGKGKDQIERLKRFSIEGASDIQTLKFRDGIVLISNKEGVYIYNMKNGSFKGVSIQGSQIFSSDIDKGRVAWDSNGGEGITIYDIANEKYTELISKGASIYGAAISGNKLFFIDYNKYELRMFEFKAD